MSRNVSLARWRPHLKAAEREGKTLRAYAREHGLSPYTLYGARSRLRRMHAEGGSSSPFAAVRVKTAATKPGSASVSLLCEPEPRLQVRLPNGVALELKCGSAQNAVLDWLLRTLAQLPCSG